MAASVRDWLFGREEEVEEDEEEGTKEDVGGRFEQDSASKIEETR